eukprot:4890255-Alexandrium_andersonii.AAC.1
MLIDEGVYVGGFEFLPVADDIHSPSPGPQSLAISVASSAEMAPDPLRTPQDSSASPHAEDPPSNDRTFWRVLSWNVCRMSADAWEA